MLTPRRPDPSHFVDGKDDSAYKRAMLEFDKQTAHKKANPAAWGYTIEPMTSDDLLAVIADKLTELVDIVRVDKKR